MRRLHATILSGFAAGFLAGTTGCVTPPPADPYGPENVFLQDRPPRYGHGGTQSPAATPPRAYQPPPGYDASQFSRSRDGTIFLPSGPPPGQASGGGGTAPSTPATTPPPTVAERSPDAGGAPSGSGGTGSGGGAGETAATGAGGSGPAGAPDPAPDAPSPTGSGSGGGDPAPEAVEPASSAPYGTPVPGKAGYVYSPFDDKKRYVDVTGIAAGTEVKCPYTEKIFRVP